MKSVSLEVRCVASDLVLSSPGFPLWDLRRLKLFARLLSLLFQAIAFPASIGMPTVDLSQHDVIVPYRCCRTYSFV